MMSGTRVAAFVLGREASRRTRPGPDRDPEESSACPPRPCPKERLLPGVQDPQKQDTGRAHHLGPQTLKARRSSPCPGSRFSVAPWKTWGDRRWRRTCCLQRGPHSRPADHRRAGLKSRPEMGKDAKACLQLLPCFSAGAAMAHVLELALQWPPEVRASEHQAHLRGRAGRWP